jgi:hypothetical protein
MWNNVASLPQVQEAAAAVTLPLPFDHLFGKRMSMLSSAKLTGLKELSTNVGSLLLVSTILLWDIPGMTKKHRHFAD